MLKWRFMKGVKEEMKVDGVREQDSEDRIRWSQMTPENKKPKEEEGGYQR